MNTPTTYLLYLPRLYGTLLLYYSYYGKFVDTRKKKWFVCDVPDAQLPAAPLSVPAGFLASTV